MNCEVESPLERVDRHAAKTRQVRQEPTFKIYGSSKKSQLVPVLNSFAYLADLGGLAVKSFQRGSF
jgi:hypothetical protein